jgi:hypothetical protein
MQGSPSVSNGLISGQGILDTAGVQKCPPVERVAAIFEE